LQYQGFEDFSEEIFAGSGDICGYYKIWLTKYLTNHIYRGRFRGAESLPEGLIFYGNHGVQVVILYSYRNGG
jgi:hypothetical protein